KKKYFIRTPRRSLVLSDRNLSQSAGAMARTWPIGYLWAIFEECGMPIFPNRSKPLPLRSPIFVIPFLCLGTFVPSLSTRPSHVGLHLNGRPVYVALWHVQQVIFH